MEKLKKVIAGEIIVRLDNYNINFNDIKEKSNDKIALSSLYNYKKGMIPSKKNSIIIIDTMRDNYINTLIDIVNQLKNDNIINDDDLIQINNYIGDNKNNG